VARLNRLKALGVQVAIDDFGTGYSSLAYLRQFPVDVLKIDRSFVADMSRSPDAAALIHTLIELGHTLGLVTLAEGIETHEQLEGLRAEGCNHGQGFLFSGPVTGVEISELLEIAHAGKRITSVDPAGAVGALAASARAARPPRRRTPSGSRPGR
jgi:EAL domain-containing protein (putative c-di-GMP-specific phosphodiesterase class I)